MDIKYIERFERTKALNIGNHWVFLKVTNKYLLLKELLIETWKNQTLRKKYQSFLHYKHKNKIRLKYYNDSITLNFEELTIFLNFSFFQLNSLKKKNLSLSTINSTTYLQKKAHHVGETFKHLQILSFLVRYSHKLLLHCPFSTYFTSYFPIAILSAKLPSPARKNTHIFFKSHPAAYLIIQRASTLRSKARNFR